jgi:hypothetical protein
LLPSTGSAGQFGKLAAPFRLAIAATPFLDKGVEDDAEDKSANDALEPFVLH